MCHVCDVESSIRALQKSKTDVESSEVGHFEEKRFCFRCTGDHFSHISKASSLHCVSCRRDHLTILYRDSVLDEKKRVTGSVPNELRGRINEATRKLSAERVNCRGRSSVVREFIDVGSQRSYLLKSTAELLDLEKSWQTAQKRRSQQGR
ncbi:unnamed protein product [Orchesella dallaii]|uniref:Uncharacterized protein n=1 Tax=Orchesella dallaii TaxID=48710 RepID=A0ABP1RAG2_9HEXA